MLYNKDRKRCKICVTKGLKMHKRRSITEIKNIGFISARIAGVFKADEG